jgi:hypothetical protein
MGGGTRRLSVDLLNACPTEMLTHRDAQPGESAFGVGPRVASVKLGKES